MTNIDANIGLRPIRHRNGASFNSSGNPYIILSTYATALFVGECVTKTGTSNTAQVRVPGGVFEVGTLPVVQKTSAGDGNPITGVVMSFGEDPDGLGFSYNPAYRERLVYLCDDPDVIFESQADGAITALTVGLNAVLIDTDSGSTATARAGVQTDTTSDVPAADLSNQLTILRALNKEGNDTTLTNARIEVKINNHTEAHATTGID